MRRTLMFSALAVVPSFVSAQAQWNDRPTGTWTDSAPRVLLTIDGPRAVAYGAPIKVRFEVSDNAFVTVVRVDDVGRMTILFPYSRSQRAGVQGGPVYYVRNPRLGGQAAFYANDRMSGGYIFAVASYTPLDFSSFENRDFDRVGGHSRFTQANLNYARRPDVFIDRFAAAVLWDKDTPYDYDVDYYYPQGHPSTLNAYSLCGSMYGSASSFGLGMSVFDWSSWDLAAYPYRSMCRNLYNGVQCFSAMSLSYYGGCNVGMVVANGPRGPIVDLPADTAQVPNEGVVLGGLLSPTPLPVLPGPEPQGELPTARFDQVRSGEGADWDHLMSIPPRATRKMKEEDARRERAATGDDSRTARDFDRSDATRGKTEKTRTADASRGGDGASTRVEAPPREPTKVKSTSEPRRETASKSGFGGSTGRTSEPRSSNNPDRVSRPASSKPTSSAPANPPSIQGTTTEKKKPPTD